MIGTQKPQPAGGPSVIPVEAEDQPFQGKITNLDKVALYLDKT
jgi:hypothetical protein